MILYHGSTVQVAKIDLEKCRPFKDFGRGFYVSEIELQARQMARRVARLHGGVPIVSKFSLNMDIFKDNCLNILTFEKPTKEWALFVINNRDRLFTDSANALCNHDNKYDCVFGAVANDDIAYLFRTFRGGLIDIDALLKGLQYKKLTNQYSFHTERALVYLKAEGVS